VSLEFGIEDLEFDWSGEFGIWDLQFVVGRRVIASEAKQES
jgi:hypothetical protein